MRGIGFFLLTTSLILLMAGCSGSRNNQRGNSESAYKKFMERQKALAADEQASKENPLMSSEELEKMGDFYVKQRNLPMAFLQYDKAFRLDRNQLNIRYKMGRLFLEKGMAEEAQNEFLEVLKVNPQHAQAFEGIGWVFFKTGDLERAGKNLQQAVALEHTLWQAHHLLGIIYDRQQNYEGAIEQYQKAISLNPNMAMLFNNLGMCLLLKGDYGEALKSFLQALKLEGSNDRVYNNLGLTLCKLGRYKEALEVFKKSGDEAAAYNNLGYIFMIEGKNKEAIEAFEKAIEIKPGFYTKAYENLKKAKTVYSSSP
jgi:Tfp pilus assembly protein PilF